jgi:hypothetical protein
MHLGHSVAVALWVMTFLSLTLVALRVYIRIRLVHFFVIEDHLYLWTGIWLLAFTVSIQLAIHYGLGRSFWTLSFDEQANAIFWTYVANTLVVIGNAFAKLSMGFFLLRVVPLRRQKAVLWLLISVTAATSIALAIMVWSHTTPIKASWDVLRTSGTWNFNIQPFAVGLGGEHTAHASHPEPLGNVQVVMLTNNNWQLCPAPATSSLPCFPGCLSGLYYTCLAETRSYWLAV